MDVVADIANAIRDGKLDDGHGRTAATARSARTEIDAAVGRAGGGRATAAWPRLRDSVRRRQPPLAGPHRRASPCARCCSRWLCGFVISWSFILPVREAQVFLGEVAAGNFAARSRCPTATNSGRSPTRMNHMSQRAAAARRASSGSGRELGTLNEQLRAGEQGKSEFLANMSHELRTPMNAILGFTEMLLDGLYGDVPAELKEPLADIQIERPAPAAPDQRRARPLQDRGGPHGARAERVLGRATSSTPCAPRCARSPPRRAWTSTAEVPDGPAVAYGDSGRLTQCLMNLAGNAIKFTRAGRVEIAVELRGRRAASTASRTPASASRRTSWSNVFAEFRQVDATITREFGGTGLGLSITKKFVEMHGGRIWVESELGQGLDVLLHRAAARGARRRV